MLRRRHIRFSISRIALRSRGWQVAAYTMVPNIQDLVVMRILVRHGFSRDMADLLLADMRRAVEHFAAYPPPHKMEAAGAPAFTH